MKRIGLDLVVTACGAATSVITALILAKLLIQGVSRTGPLGWVGYLKAGIQAIGFMVGPILAYKQTQNIPYCDRCSQAPDQNAFARRFTTFPGDIEKAWKTAEAASELRRFGDALAGFQHLGHETFSPEWPFRCSFTLYRCGSCGDHIVDCLSEQKTGVLWRRMGELSRRKLVPVAGLGG